MSALSAWASSSRLLDIVGLFWPYLASAFGIAAATLAAGHAAMTKQDERAAVGWIGVIVLVPALGPLLYVLFGINRIRRKAAAAAPRRPVGAPNAARHANWTPPVPLTAAVAHLDHLQHMVDRVVARPLVPGNEVIPLQNGDEAYPAMLAAIDGAQRSVALATYIFDRDQVGARFHAALVRASRRGVQVRVLIDAVGSRYSFPSMARALRQSGVQVALFGQALWPWRMPYANLRNHRKILLVDGALGFTGGINVRAGHMLRDQPRDPVADTHFSLRGPVLGSLWETFAQDWAFTTGERLEGECWQLDAAPSGSVWARGIVEGPDADINKLPWVLMGALSCAQHSVHVVTPYFLPNQLLLAALKTTAMRGVRVHIILPEHNNLTLVKWASTALLPALLAAGCEVHSVAGDFDHSKVMLVDEVWSLIGSANWDPRSLRLNFEFNVECYDRVLAARLAAIIADKLTRARPLSERELLGRPFVWRLRDNLARLLAPYL